MADIQLQPGESVVGQGMMAYWEPVLGSSCDVWRGTIFVTNQKECIVKERGHPENSRQSGRRRHRGAGKDAPR